MKVLDFGLAKLMETSAREMVVLGASPDTLTEEGRILGTVEYMSPEQAEGKPVDNRSDVFSLGILLYEMATGARPFTGDSRLSVLSAIVRTRLAPSRTSIPPCRVSSPAWSNAVSRRRSTPLSDRH